MKPSNNMSELFDKLNDLKTVFRYGQRLIPIIQSLIDFMKETVPLLENINNSIADSTQKMPKATNQISNVTSATELATTEILDLVDVISNDVTSIENELKGSLEKKNESDKMYNKIIKLISGDAKALELLKAYRKFNDNIPLLKDLIDSCDKIRNDAYNITLSLQVQDITSQQLAAVNHLIESVQERLSSLIIDLKDTNSSEFVINMEAPENAAFNPNARYTKTANLQETADSIINDEKSKTSQDEIDKLFYGR